MSGEDDVTFDLSNGATLVDRDDGGIDIWTAGVNFSLTPDGELDAASGVAAVSALKRIVRDLLYERTALRERAATTTRRLDDIKHALGALGVLSPTDYTPS